MAPDDAVGTVQFKSNGTAIGSPVTVTSGVAALSHAFDAAGAQSITADFTARCPVQELGCECEVQFQVSVADRES
ncbi:Ig-like domain-containing protein [Rhodococcus sp. GB-02]